MGQVKHNGTQTGSLLWIEIRESEEVLRMVLELPWDKDQDMKPIRQLYGVL